MYCNSLPERAQHPITHPSAQHGHRHRVLCTSSSARPEAMHREPARTDSAVFSPASRWDGEPAAHSPHAVLFAFVAELRDRLAEASEPAMRAGAVTSAHDRARLSEQLDIEVTVDGFRLLAGPIHYAQFADGEPLGDAALDQLITGWLALLP